METSPRADNYFAGIHLFFFFAHISAKCGRYKQKDIRRIQRFVAGSSSKHSTDRANDKNMKGRLDVRVSDFNDIQMNLQRGTFHQSAVRCTGQAPGTDEQA
jgi:hypothetical protein